ncbi:MAG: malate synthase A [Acidobacteria bacterium]|nr:malate synthase A [Acidobacteriota bacterium]
MSKPREEEPALRVLGQNIPGQDEILTPEACAFIAGLCRSFAPRVEELLQLRREKQAVWDAGESLDFLPETRELRAAPWAVDPLPGDLQDRRVEITGPVDRKMIINALNSPANVFMADFEDSNSPTWSNVIQGQVNLRDAVAGTIRFEDPVRGKEYKLAQQTAVLMVRPRGWHLVERHMEAHGRPVPASLVDFGLYFFHNARPLLAGETGPYFYLPKLQSHLEARLWNDVFVHAQEALGVPQSTIKATVLIETLPAAFEMDEILHELRHHSAGLNCGRWDYIFSYIKTLRAHAANVLPDRAQVTMEQPFMGAYTQLLIRTCHRREVHAMGGMAAQIPIRGDEKANEQAMAMVRADKLREVKSGHDGTWVAHPGLVPVAREIFDAHLSMPNQIDRLRDDVKTTAADLLEVPKGTRTEHGLRWNINVGIRYLASWLDGNGCVPLYNLMEDAATAEISRTQIWQWIHHGAHLEDGRQVTADLFRQTLAEEMDRVRQQVGEEVFAAGRFTTARDLFERLSLADMLDDFLTLPAYEMLEDGS